MKAKHFSSVVALAASLALFGCAHPLFNVTPPQTASNPSRIYTLFVNARMNDPAMVDGSMHAYITIEGQEHEMSPAPYGDQFYQYEYAMPADRAQAKYFFTLRYDTKEREILRHRDVESEIYTLKLVDRYVLQMLTTRGPVGSTVAVVGSGFAPDDYIIVAGNAAQTRVSSPNAMTFAVPPMPPGDYPVEWHSGSQVTPIGAFHVDIAKVSADPASITVGSGDATALSISISQPAPDAGMAFDVLTDVPASVIMPSQIVIPGGQMGATVKIEGGNAGTGSLHISAPGFERAVVSITVNPPPVLPESHPMPPVDNSPPTSTPLLEGPGPSPAPAAPAATTPASKDVPAAAVMGS